MIEISVFSSGPGPRKGWGWQYPETHRALRDGRVLSYWINVACAPWTRMGTSRHGDTRLVSEGVAVFVRVT